MLPLVGLPCLPGACSDDLLAVQQSHRKAMKPPPLQPLHDRGPLRPAHPRDRRVVKPLIVVARDFEVGGPHQPATPAARGLCRGDLGRLSFSHLAERPATVGQLHEFERHRPERARAAERDEREQARDHHDRQRQGPAGQPDPGLSMGRETRIRRPQPSGAVLFVRAHGTSCGTAAERSQQPC